MSTPPLFVLNPLPAGDVIVLGGAEGRHAARVRRLAAGEPVLVADGHGSIARCRVYEARGDALTLDVMSRRFEPEPEPRLVVVQALPKSDHAELAVELLTELGADEIVPWAAARSIGQWRDRSLDKWRRTATEAAKQSRRARIPQVGDVARTTAAAARVNLVLHEDAETPLASARLPDGDLVLAVGPEGGITPDELSAFGAATPVRLGTPVLRTSTAGAAALAVLSVRLGRWQ